MKKICYLLLLALTQLSTQAQSANQVLGSRLSHYVFDQFAPGKVYLHSGEVSDRKLNYNTLTYEMIFDNNGQPLAIANPQSIDSVIIQGRKFIPVNKKFYEWVAGTTYPVYADYIGSVEEQGVSSGYGSTTATSSSNVMKSLHGAGTVYALQLPEEYKVTTKTVYLLRKDNTYTKLSNPQQLGKLVPDKKKWLGEYLKANPVDFNQREEVIRLIKALEAQ
ncbi:hypothetical protein [Paraflavitalea pollutisoli]|uniref:hypothetical protein n=1 Tax=Paraflavitalea pollutisoli TaxID=3034143 RepID=UPI0023EDB037|nr:hypothetical protein [Paraflavitalea sp. H1-2-19X]